MTQIDLADRVNGSKSPKFKSKGERNIAYLLDFNSIKYIYEPPVLVNLDDGKSRIWYPDFFLPEFQNYIEYFGLVDQKEYAKGAAFKMDIYRKMGMDVIPITPKLFKGDWQGYIMRTIDRSIKNRYRNLMTKPYWSGRKPKSYNSGMRKTQRGYR